MKSIVQSFCNSPKNSQINQSYSEINFESFTKNEDKEKLQIELKCINKHNQGKFVNVSYT